MTFATHLEPMSCATLLWVQRNTRKCDVWGCSVHKYTDPGRDYATTTLLTSKPNNIFTDALEQRAMNTMIVIWIISDCVQQCQDTEPEHTSHHTNDAQNTEPCRRCVNSWVFTITQIWHNIERQEDDHPMHPISLERRNELGLRINIDKHTHTHTLLPAHIRIHAPTAAEMKKSSNNWSKNPMAQESCSGQVRSSCFLWIVRPDVLSSTSQSGSRKNSAAFWTSRTIAAREPPRTISDAVPCTNHQRRSFHTLAPPTAHQRVKKRFVTSQDEAMKSGHHFIRHWNRRCWSAAATNLLVPPLQGLATRISHMRSNLLPSQQTYQTKLTQSRIPPLIGTSQVWSFTPVYWRDGSANAIQQSARILPPWSSKLHFFAFGMAVYVRLEPSSGPPPFSGHASSQHLKRVCTDKSVTASRSGAPMTASPREAAPVAESCTCGVKHFDFSQDVRFMSHCARTARSDHCKQEPDTKEDCTRETRNTGWKQRWNHHMGAQAACSKQAEVSKKRRKGKTQTCKLMSQRCS